MRDLTRVNFQTSGCTIVALAPTRESLHNGWDKNDPKDAQVILHRLRIGGTRRYVGGVSRAEPNGV